MATFQAWTRLIYNFAIGGHIASEKPLKLMMTPIKNCFLSERHKRVRLTCTTTWISLIYALGSKLPKNADQVLFPILKLVVSDDSEHVRDLALRLLVALFSNTGGQELVEGRSNIVPGTITFADLGLTDATWVRTELLDSGLDCLFRTICLQHKITDVGRERWKSLDLTDLPLLTLQCTKTWDGVVKAIRDINLQEKGMKATPEAEQAISSLLFFVDKVSKCDPKVLIPGEWPISHPEKINHLKSDPKMSGFIVRADITNFLFVRVIDNFTARALVTTRYRVKDIIHTELYDAINSADPEVPSEENAASQRLPVRDVFLSPLEFILKSWLAVGESVIQTVLEDQFWLATAIFVELITKGISALRPLYKCLDHMEDIITKRFSTSTAIWPSFSNGPLEPNAFRIFQCKYWAIVAQRLGSTIEKTNEITDDVTLEDENRHHEFFIIMTYPFSILNVLPESQQETVDMDHSQKAQESQGIQDKVQFISTFNETLLPAWTGLARSFYKVAQQKYNSGNSALNTLADRIKSIYDKSLPFVWIQSLSISMASVIAETIVLVDVNSNFHNLQGPGGKYSQTSNSRRSKQAFDSLLMLCSFLLEESYSNIEVSMDQVGATHIPSIQESAFLLMEKIINKAPPTYTAHWLSKLQHSIVQWVEDPQMKISRLPKASRRLYRARIDSFWSRCVLQKLLGCSSESKIGGPKSAFGSVLPPPVSTIRGAVQAGANITAGHSSPSRSAMLNPFLVNNNINASNSSDGDMEVFDSEILLLLTPMLFAGLNSHYKSIVNSTLEFWNKTFGLSKKGLDYPDEIVSIMQQLKLVAIISLPGWSIEDSSQTEVPQFASLSQDQLSLPMELNTKYGLSRLLKEKAEIAKQLSPKKRLKRMRMLGLETPDTATLAATALDSGSSSNYSSTSNSRASSPSPWSTQSSVRKRTSASHSDISLPESYELSGGLGEKGEGIEKPGPGELRKRKKSIDRTEHSLETEPIRDMDIETRGASIMESGSHPNTPDDSDDAPEVSSPSKRAKLTSDRKGEMQLQRMTSAIDWNQSPAEIHGSLASRNDTPLHDSQSDAFSIMPAQPSAPSPTEDVASGTNGDQRFKVSAEKDTTDQIVASAILDSNAVSDVDTRDTASIANSHEAVMIKDSEVSSCPTIDGKPLPTSTEYLAITSKRDFAASMQRLVEARDVVNQMDMRQLLELQNQLMTLNQSVHGVWSQFVTDQSEGSNKDVNSHK
ncbi:hypothetical protein BGZ76_000547 [Entomortierella beljakovae]|nr:hypothetical protein BGZ76_000547 [Entomortierella beljakovae]